MYGVTCLAFGYGTDWDAGEDLHMRRDDVLHGTTLRMSDRLGY